MAFDLMLISIYFASDCANAIRSIAGTGMGLYGQVMEEIRCRAHDFLYVDFAHENRKSNVDARSSISFDTGRHVWLLELPFGFCNYYDQLHQ